MSGFRSGDHGVGHDHDPYTRVEDPYGRQESPMRATQNWHEPAPGQQTDVHQGNAHNTGAHTTGAHQAGAQTWPPRDHLAPERAAAPVQSYDRRYDDPFAEDAEWPSYDDDMMPDAPPVRRWGPLANGLGAVASLGLLVAVGLWGTELVMRDVSGIPVVRAVDGPMRELPENPGGQLAAHQGLTVNNVAAVGSAAAPADRLMLAPAPMDLADSDVSVVALPDNLPSETQPQDPVPSVAAVIDILEPEETAEVVQVAATPSATPATRLPQLTSVQPTSGQTAPDPGGDTVLDIDTMAARISNGTLTPVALPVATGDSASQSLTVPTDRAVTAAPAAAQLRPRLRPAGLTLASATPTAAPASALASADIEASLRAMMASDGGEMVQLGAVTTQDKARREWARLSGLIGDEINRHEKLTQQGTSGGQVIYRLRLAGFADRDEARRFCASVKARGPDCIVVLR